MEPKYQHQLLECAGICQIFGAHRRTKRFFISLNLDAFIISKHLRFLFEPGDLLTPASLQSVLHMFLVSQGQGSLQTRGRFRIKIQLRG